MANVFDQFDMPLEPAQAPAAPAAVAPANPFDQFDMPAGPGVRAPADPNAVDWSRMNQPLGTLAPADYSPTERVTNAAQDLLMKAGAQPPVARHLAEGGTSIATLSPVLGSALAGANLPYDISRGNYVRAGLDVAGASPGVLAARRLVQGMPTIPMADIPRTPVAQASNLGRFLGPRTQDELRNAADDAYDRVRNNPMVFTPQMMDDIVFNARTQLTQRGLNPVKAPSIFAVLDAAGAPRPRGAIITPNDLDTLRQQLRGGVPGTQDALAGSLVTDILDRQMANPAAHHVLSGSRTDLDALRTDLATGRGNWRAYKTADTVEGKIDTSAIKAGTTHSGGNLDNTTRQYLQSLVTTKAGQRALFGARPDEKAAILGAAGGDWLTNAQRYGSKLLGGGGGLGQYVASAGGAGAGGTISHMLGADPITATGISGVTGAATMGAGVGLRQAAEARTVRAAERVADLIRSHSPEYAARMRATPPVIDPMAMRRDAITYALMPQLAQAGRSAWDQAHVPYANAGETYDPSQEQP